MLVFNYRLPRARRVVENAFGILANHWACLLTTLSIDVKTVEKVVIAACTLHNMMRQEYPTAFNVDTEDANHQVVPGAWCLEDRKILAGTGDPEREQVYQGSLLSEGSAD